LGGHDFAASTQINFEMITETGRFDIGSGFTDTLGGFQNVHVTLPFVQQQFLVLASDANGFYDWEVVPEPAPLAVIALSLGWLLQTRRRT
jgi:hypothetical protein